PIINDTDVSMATPDRVELLLPAPGRGQYDRAQTRERRQAEQRERLLLATAGAFARGRASVSGVVELAGVGRNTFYEYFDDYPHALAALRSHTLERMDAAWRPALGNAHTPLERLRAVCRAWCTEMLVSADEAVALLCAEARTVSQPLSSAGRELAAAVREARARSDVRVSDDEQNILALAAAAEALVLSCLASPNQVNSNAPSEPAALAIGSRAETLLASAVIQVAQRLLR
ncbi:MAG TPA: TetR/AcrR family transcriptional regulator, partial [Polyangiaceae bacterium]|nr:TetR/AcrR family transcriptional regulator [Polyangiaceae bacterium]